MSSIDQRQLESHLEDVKGEIDLVKGELVNLKDVIQDVGAEFNNKVERLVSLLEKQLEKGYVPAWSVIILSACFLLAIALNASLENKEFIKELIGGISSHG